MSERGPAGRSFSGEQLIDLTEQLRMRLFKAGMSLAVLLAVGAGAMILIVGEQVQLRLALLVLVGAMFAMVSSEAPWCYSVAKRHPWTVLGPATLAAAILTVEGGRENGTFVVIGAALITVPVATGFTPAIIAFAVVIGGYVSSIALRGQPLLFNGSPGDIAAILSLLAAIYAADRAADLATMAITDINRESLIVDHLRRATQNHSGSRVALRRRRGASAGELRSRGPYRLSQSTRLAAQTDVVASPASVSVERSPSFYVSPELLRNVLSSAGSDEPAMRAVARLSEFGLTRAEQPVALLAGDGMQQKEIAQRLNKSPRTVEKQLASIRVKMDAPSHAALTAKVAAVLALRSTGQSRPAS